jgi:hypothetical protein
MEDRNYASILGFLLLIMVIFAFVPVIILALIFSKGVSSGTKVESEIVNGLVTVSSLIFAFQPTFFKTSKRGTLRLAFTAIFLVEGILLTLTGYSYVINTLNQGYLSISTLFIASGSLFFNASMTVFFVLADLAVQSSARV